MMNKLILTVLLAGGFSMANAQQAAKHEDTEFYEPVPKVVTPGKTNNDPPSDAVILFGSGNLNQWVYTDDSSKPVEWPVSGDFFTVKKGTSNIETKRKFNNYQLHVEWKIPTNITGEGQARGNSGVFLASTGKGDSGYELQILDSYNNKTYVNGQAGSIYKQSIPLANANKKPGEWQTYDIIWQAPTFKTDGSVNTPATVTVIFNGVVVQNHYVLKGETAYVGQPKYKAYSGGAPIKLQAHGDKSEPISYRNIWVREL